MPFTRENAASYGALGGGAKTNKPKGFAKRPELASGAAKLKWKKHDSKHKTDV